jgi:hypothetical protein
MTRGRFFPVRPRSLRPDVAPERLKVTLSFVADSPYRTNLRPVSPPERSHPCETNAGVRGLVLGAERVYACVEAIGFIVQLVLAILSHS